MPRRTPPPVICVCGGRCCRSYVDFLNLDVDLFVQHLAYRNRDVFDVASLRSVIVEHRWDAPAVPSGVAHSHSRARRPHRSAASQILEDIPAAVNIGLFSVNLSEVRSALSQKYLEVRWRVVVVVVRLIVATDRLAVLHHPQIADKVVAMVQDFAVSTARAVCEASTAICSALSTQPSNIEQLTEMKEFQNTIPEKVRLYPRSLSLPPSPFLPPLY